MIAAKFGSGNVADEVHCPHPFFARHSGCAAQVVIQIGAGGSSHFPNYCRRGCGQESAGNVLEILHHAMVVMGKVGLAILVIIVAKNLAA
jgi:hypothetical protein